MNHLLVYSFLTHSLCDITCSLASIYACTSLHWPAETGSQLHRAYYPSLSCRSCGMHCISSTPLVLVRTFARILSSLSLTNESQQYHACIYV
jgi:hypothetical protein